MENIRPVDESSLAQAVAVLRDGGLVALPTETVYGLAADAQSDDAVASIYAIKGRPDFNPLIVHTPSFAIAQAIADFSPLAVKLAENFWPGPLTLVLPVKEGTRIAAAVTAGLPTIALRVPAHPVMQAVLLESGLVLAAPSANKSGAISPTRAEHVSASLGDKVPLILDGGPCEAGLESTIIAVRGTGEWQVLRPGPITVAEIQAIAGTRAWDERDRKIEAPGQLESHYAPSKPLRLGVKTAETHEFHIGFGEIAGHYNLSASGSLEQAAARLYAALHIADTSEHTAIAVAPVLSEGVGIAINDRLARAAK